jgi:hypothetical protein
MIKWILLLILFFGLLHGGDLRWESSEWIWNLGVAQSCDKGLTRKPEGHFEKNVFDEAEYKDIAKGDVVWVKSQFIKTFYKKVLPKVKNPFVLVICDGDESFPSNSRLKKHLEEFVNHKMILHIFAQNCDYKGPSHKVSHLPIGIDFHTLAYRSQAFSWGKKASPSEQEKELKELLQQLKPTHLRKKRAFVDFQHNNNVNSCYHRAQEFGEDRSSIFERLKASGLIDYSDRMPRAHLWKSKGEYAFSISPHGNGLDCHRTWEDLILGCIVIVKTSPLDPLYEGLPVVIVKDWSEVTEDNLTKWLERYKDAFTNPSYRTKLTNRYWLNKIRSAATEF